VGDCNYTFDWLRSRSPHNNDGSISKLGCQTSQDCRNAARRLHISPVVVDSRLWSSHEVAVYLDRRNTRHDRPGACIFELVSQRPVFGAVCCGKNVFVGIVSATPYTMSGIVRRIETLHIAVFQ
jgi:hypothetical protein